jgi:hypothetical protein
VRLNKGVVVTVHGPVKRNTDKRAVELASQSRRDHSAIAALETAADGSASDRRPRVDGAAQTDAVPAAVLVDSTAKVFVRCETSHEKDQLLIRQPLASECRGAGAMIPYLWLATVVASDRVDLAGNEAQDFADAGVEYRFHLVALRTCYFVEL